MSLGALELGDYENMHAMDGVFWHVVVKSAEGVENEFVLLNPDVCTGEKLIYAGLFSLSAYR